MSQSWQRFHEWMKCVAVVTFDLELGQKMEYCFPNGVELSEQERSDVGYLSLPDTHSTTEPELESRFYFRILLKDSKENDLKVLKVHKKLRDEAEHYLEPESKHLIGIAYFRQVRDSTLHRGFYQKSVVILTQLPFYNLYSHVIDLIAPEYFSKGEAALEAMAAAINRWPSPVAGFSLELPFLGSVLRVRLPSDGEGNTIRSVDSKIIPAIQPTPGTILIPHISDLDLMEPLLPCIQYLGVLWELTLLGEPLLIIANTPQLCSQAVLALTSLIRPFHYCNELRPYFTIHDSDFKSLTAPFSSHSSTNSSSRRSGGENDRQTGLIIGVTNPFFCKTLNKIPHILRLGDGTEKSSGKIKPIEKIKALDSKPGFYTNHKSIIDKDKKSLEKLIKNIQGNTRRPPEVSTALIRRYFATLTRAFEYPLERYVTSLMPLKKQINPFKPIPSPNPFDVKKFMSTLDRQGPHLSSSVTGDWPILYREFFKRQTNFLGWLEKKKIECRSKIYELHSVSLAEADMNAWVIDKNEIEITDLILQLKQKLSELKDKHQSKLYYNINNQMDLLIGHLPADTQKIMKASKVGQKMIISTDSTDKA